VHWWALALLANFGPKIKKNVSGKHSSLFGAVVSDEEIFIT